MSEKELQPSRKVETRQYTPIMLPGSEGLVEVEKAILERTRQLERVPDNLDYLNRIPSDLLHPFMVEVRDELNRVYNIYKNRLEEIIKADSTLSKIKQIFGEDLLFISDEAEMPGVDTRGLLDAVFRNTPGNFICLSDTHAMTHFSIEAAENAGVNVESLVVIVFDNHPDVFYEDDKKRNISEGNVFLALAGNGIINSAVIIGSQSSETVIPSANDVMNSAMKEVCPDADDQDWFIGLDRRLLISYEENTGKTRKESLADQITKMIDSLRHDGIKNVVFSIDIDFLNASSLGYSGFQYNPIELLKQLARIDTSKYIDPSKLTQETAEGVFLDILVGLDKLFKKFDEKNGDVELTDYVNEKVWRNPISQNLRNKNYDPQTLTMGNVGRSIDQIIKECRYSGIEVGLKLEGGGRYIGDVVGFEGVDYHGMTAKATKALADRLAKSVLY